MNRHALYPYVKEYQVTGSPFHYEWYVIIADDGPDGHHTPEIMLWGNAKTRRGAWKRMKRNLYFQTNGKLGWR